VVRRVLLFDDNNVDELADYKGDDHRWFKDGREKNSVDRQNGYEVL